MIPRVIPIAGIASRQLRLRRSCAPPGKSAALRQLRPPLALQTSGSAPAAALTPTLSATPCVPARACLPPLAA
jgi:hypothetical protein